jgi:hypothetical protein
MSDYFQTRREKFFSGIRDEIVRVAIYRVECNLRNCNFESAGKALSEVGCDYKRIMNAHLKNPRLIPVQYTRLNANVVAALDEGGFETLGHIADAWPANILTCPGIDVNSHTEIWEVLRSSGLLRKAK